MTTNDYQVWSYSAEAEYDVVSEHRCVAFGLSFSKAETLCNRLTEKNIHRYLKTVVRDDEHEPDVEQLPTRVRYYIRREREPTYLLFTSINGGPRSLFGMFFYGDIADQKVELVEHLATTMRERSGGSLILTYETEMRDDSADRADSMYGARAARLRELVERLSAVDNEISALISNGS